MGIGLLFWIQLSGSWTRWVVSLGGVAIGGLLYLAGVLTLKVPEIKIMMKAIMSRLLRRPATSA
jgi:hypothetical protein